MEIARKLSLECRVLHYFLYFFRPFNVLFYMVYHRMHDGVSPKCSLHVSPITSTSFPDPDLKRTAACLKQCPLNINLRHEKLMSL